MLGIRLFLVQSGDRKIPCRCPGRRTLLHGLGYGPLLISNELPKQVFVRESMSSPGSRYRHVTLPKNMKMKEKTGELVANLLELFG